MRKILMLGLCVAMLGGCNAAPAVSGNDKAVVDLSKTNEEIVKQLGELKTAIAGTSYWSAASSYVFASIFVLISGIGATAASLATYKYIK
jgi:hypothetical protein